MLERAVKMELFGSEDVPDYYKTREKCEGTVERYSWLLEHFLITIYVPRNM